MSPTGWPTIEKAEETARSVAKGIAHSCGRKKTTVLLAEYDARGHEIERLRQEAANAHADALVRQATLTGLTVEEGAAVLELGPPRELVIAWVNAAREMLGDAPNYSETRVDFPSSSMEFKAAGEVERYVFTVQRAGKVTPHEARRLAEEERDRVTAQRDTALALHPREEWGDDSLDGVRAVCGYCRDSGEEPLAWPCPTAAALGAGS